MRKADVVLPFIVLFVGCGQCEHRNDPQWHVTILDADGNKVGYASFRMSRTWTDERSYLSGDGGMVSVKSPYTIKTHHEDK